MRNSTVPSQLAEVIISIIWYEKENDNRHRDRIVSALSFLALQKRLYTSRRTRWARLGIRMKIEWEKIGKVIGIAAAIATLGYLGFKFYKQHSANDAAANAAASLAAADNTQTLEETLSSLSGGGSGASGAYSPMSGTPIGAIFSSNYSSANPPPGISAAQITLPVSANMSGGGNATSNITGAYTQLASISSALTGTTIPIQTLTSEESAFVLPSTDMTLADTGPVSQFVNNPVSILSNDASILTVPITPVITGLSYTPPPPPTDAQQAVGSPTGHEGNAGPNGVNGAGGGV